MMGTPKGTAFTLNSSSPKLTFFTDGELRSEQERGWGGGGRSGHTRRSQAGIDALLVTPGFRES